MDATKWGYSQPGSEHHFPAQRGRRPPGSPRRPSSWAPSARELRKYATLFLKVDSNRDGFVEADEAQMLCGRSGLSLDVLGLAWEYADADRDGRLRFTEFVVLAHIVTCCLQGMQLQPPSQGPPAELLRAVAGIHQPPEELDGQRSSSPSSRSSSTAPSSRASTPAPSSSTLPKHATTQK